MKKTLLLLAGAMLASVSVLAQPAKPDVTFMSFADAVGSGENVYLYNVEAGLFLADGNDWGTRAGVASNGGSGVVSFDDVKLGKAHAYGTGWQIGEQTARETADGTVDCYSFQWGVQANGTVRSNVVYMTADNWTDADWTNATCDGIWVDGDAGRPYDKWYIVSKDDAAKTFQLAYLFTTTEGEGDAAVEVFKKVNGVFGLTYLDVDGNTRTYISPDAPYSTWAIVSADEYASVQPLLDLYYVGQGLKKLVDDAKALGLDAAIYGEAEATLDNPASTYDEIVAAINAITPKVSLGNAIKAAKELDAARSWATYEALYSATDSASVAGLPAAVDKVNALIALKKALNAGAEADAAHSFAPQAAVYASDEVTTDSINKTTTLVNAFVTLKGKLDAAIAEYPSVSFAEPQAVYDNPQATIDEVNAAIDKVAAIIIAHNESIADFDNPADITERIGYLIDLDAIAAGNGSVPKAGWTSTKREGNFHINTWSVEGNEGNDGTNMTTPFLEYWKGAGNVLDDQKFFRDPEKWPFEVQPGAYRISANIRLFNESGASFMKGVSLYGNINNTPLVGEGDGPENAIEGAIYGNYNGMLFYWKDSFETYAIVPEGGKLEFGMKTEGANFNWIASKGWKVEYLGNNFRSLDYARQNSSLVVPEYAEDTYATKQLLSDFNSAKATYTSASDAAGILAAYGTLQNLADSIVGNVAAYAAYKALLDEIENDPSIAELVGDYKDLLDEYVAEGNVEGPSEVYPNGTAYYILGQCALTTDQIVAETKFLEKLKSDALSNDMAPGSDATSLLKNPSFADGFNGWSGDGGTLGGLKAYPCVETYGRTVNVYQEVDAPNGIYSISCRAFNRLNDAYPNHTYLFMNDFETEVQGQQADGIAEDDAENMVNCFISGGTPGEDYYNTGGTTNADNSFVGDDGRTYYVPNGMSGASYAFRAGRYEQKCYGLVENGKMKIGLTSKGLGSEWVLWADFHLTYEGKTVEALSKVLPHFTDDAINYELENEEVMSTPAFDALDAAVAAAQNADEADVMWDALLNINKELANARANVAAMEALIAALENLDDVAGEYFEQAQTEAKEAYENLQNDFVAADGQDAYIKALTTAEATAFTTKVYDIAAALKVPAPTGTDDNPQDYTQVIVNANFEQTNTGAADYGWTWSKKTGNGPVWGSGSSFNGTNACEFWSGNGAADLEFNLYQKLTGLPAGKYELSFQSANSLNGQPDLNNPGRAALYVITSGGVTASTPVAVQTEGCNEKYAKYSVVFTLNEGEDVTVGVKNVGVMTARWFTCDEFELWYSGTESAKVDSEDEGLVVIDGVDAAEAAAIEAIYTVTGTPVNSLQKGINIVRYANGKVAKVLVK